MEEIIKPFQITLTNNNNITAHIHDSKLQEKFFQFLQTELDNEYLVELYELENLKKIYKLKFATEIHFNTSFEFNHEQINLTDFKRLKKITTGNMDFFEQLLLPDGLKEIKFVGENFNSQLVNLPSNLWILNLEYSQNYNCVLDNLPLGLKELYLNSNYLHPLDYLPESLEKLYFKCINTYPHSFDNLPNNINELCINRNFLNKINKFPKNLKKLVIDKRTNNYFFNKKEFIEKIIKIKNFNDKIEIVFF
jgi:hypothetical protein